MKKTLFTLAAILGIGLLFTSCTKTVTQNNNDLQALTSLFTIKPSDWATNQNNDGFNVQFNTSDITTDITDYGAVWIYISTDGGNSYELLPSNANNGYDFVGLSGDDGSGANPGYVLIYAFTNSGQKPNFDIKVKVVSIPSTLSQQYTNVNYKDYNEVKRVFKLK